VNPNTVVVIQSGTPVAMPWESQCRALVQAWYGGNETGNAISDVLFGIVNPVSTSYNLFQLIQKLTITSFSLPNFP